MKKKEIDVNSDQEHTGVSIFNKNIDRIERFHSLQSGQYWKSLRDIPEESILESDSLLIESIRWADGKMHTIVLRAHPRHYGRDIKIPLKDGRGYRYSEMKNHSFLFDDFCNSFIFSPDAKTERDSDVKRIQELVAVKQKELTTATTDPQKLQAIALNIMNERKKVMLKEKGTALVPAVIDESAMLLASASLNSAISIGVNEVQVQNMQDAAKNMSELAQIQSEWITSRSIEMTSLLSSMAPYFNEVGAASLASTEDVRNHVNQLLEGIKSLDLYTGKDVVVNHLVKGASAGQSEKLTFTQNLLYLEEELAVILDLDEWFDFSDNKLFFNALKNRPSLIEQIFPSPRCIVAMATTRRKVNYKDVWESAQKDPLNAAVFLLVRDGDNIYQVISPIESHLGSERLFPSTDELENIFMGIDGEKINYNDVRYTNRLDTHNSRAIHYKRMLILCAGLDHRLHIFGDFYDRSEASRFVTLEFQGKYFRFIHDDDGEGLLHNPEALNRPSLSEYIKQCNLHLRSGSRVMCHWHSLLNPETAPGAIRETPDDKYSRFYIRHTPIKDKEIVIARSSANDIVVDMATSGYSSASRMNKNLNIKVALNKFNAHWQDGSHSLPFLVLDAVNPDDLDWYINNRYIRQNHLYYIRLFKKTSQLLKEERAIELPVRHMLRSALNEGCVGIAAQRESVVNRSVIAWRAANRGAPLCEVYSSANGKSQLLDLMYMISGKAASSIPDIESFYKHQGYVPLRLIVTSKGKLGIYLAPNLSERDDRLESHKWVHLAVVEMKKHGFKEISRHWASLCTHNVSETTIHEWPEAVDWAGLKSAFGSFNQKQRAFQYVDKNIDLLDVFSDQQKLLDLSRQWKRAYDKINLKGRSGGEVRAPTLIIPVGIAIKNNKISFVKLCSHLPHKLIHQSLEDERNKDELVRKYCEWYSNPERAKDVFFRNKHVQRLSIITTETTADEEGGVFTTNTNFECDSIYSYSDHPALEGLDNLNERWSALLYISSQIAHERNHSCYGEIKSDLWIHDRLIDNASGNPAIDEHCGLVSCDNKPVDLFHVKANQEPIVIKSNKPFKSKEWFDIAPSGTSEKTLMQGLACSGYELSTLTFGSESAALLYMLKSGLNVKKEARSYWGAHEEKITPDEVVRWFIKG